MKKNKFPKDKNAPKVHIFNVIENVVNGLVLPMIITRRENKHFRPIKYNQYYASQYGPFIKTGPDHKESLIDWVSWVSADIENVNKFTQELDQALLKHDMAWESFIIEITKDMILIKEDEHTDLPRNKKDHSISSGAGGLASANS